MENSLLFYTVVAILLSQFTLHFVLDYLNSKRFEAEIPDSLTDVFEAGEYKKSQEYKRANYKFGLISGGFSLLLTLAFLWFGGFNWLDSIVRSYASNSIAIALLFFAILILGSDIVNTPFALYKTYVIEEKYGFNKTNLKTFILDKIKGLILMAVVGGSLLALFILFYEWAGPTFWLYMWATVVVLMLFFNFFYSRLIVPLFNKQEPLEEGSLKKAIEAYANKVGFELQNIFVIDGSKRSTKANAYFSGFGKQKRITLFDTLINELNEQEIVAVLAHEVGHYKKKHVVINLIASVLLTGFTLFLLSIFISNPSLSSAIGVQQPSFHAGLLAFVLLYSPISEFTGLIMNYLSRKFEFQADHYAKETFAPEPLVSSLKKLSKNSLSNLTPHPAYVFVHYSHPPLIERITKLSL